MLGEIEDLGRLLDLARDLGLVDLGLLETEAHVLAHGHVRVQRVVLEHHRDVAVLGREVIDQLAVDPQLPVADLLEAGDHPQRGRLAAARGPDQDHQLPVADLEVEILDGERPVIEPLGQPL